MAFNPFDEKGMPPDKQVQNWSELNVKPYERLGIDPYTRTRIIFMNGIEVESVMFLHQFNRHTEDPQLKQLLAQARRAEQQQQKMVNWLIPAEESVLEVTIGYEQVAVDLTAWLAQTEPDPYVKAALDFALLEDFDHLYRYANLLEMDVGERAEEIVGDYTEIMPGRPTIVEHRHPFDSVRRPYNDRTADILTKLHVQTIVAAEQQTMNFYMNSGNRYPNMLGRGLYLEIGQIEEQHVSHYESLADPNVSWLDRLILHDYNEAYLYYSCMETEVEPRIRRLWEMCLDMEIGHLHMDRQIIQKMEGRDPISMFPSQFPELTVFKSNKDYVRRVLAEQVNLTARETEFVPVSEMMGTESRFEKYQQMVNSGDTVPSRDVITRNIDRKGEDYRWTSEGSHPVQSLDARDKVPKGPVYK